MATAIEITFPAGRYHATPWRGSANSSRVEWPPSLWRLARGLLATRHTRCPDIPEKDIERIISSLGLPGAYSAPRTSDGSTRHYMPDNKHTRASRADTDLIIDAFLAIDPDDALIIRWDADLDSRDRETLGRLVSNLPYLGRSESVCVARLLESDPEIDESWWRLGESGPDSESTELLAPEFPTTLKVLEQTTVQVRRGRALQPKETRVVTYGRRTRQETATVPRRAHRALTGVGFELVSTVPVQARNLLTATDAMHRAVSSKLVKQAGPSNPAVGLLLGVRDDRSPAQNDHAHLHVLALPDQMVGDRLTPRTPITRLVLWTPPSSKFERPLMSPSFAATIQNKARVIYAPSAPGGGIARQYLAATGAGEVREFVGDSIAGTSRIWTSLTPYLPVRHRKRGQTLDDWISADIQRECQYRNLPAPTSVRVYDTAQHRRDAIQFVTRRMKGRRGTKAEGSGEAPTPEAGRRRSAFYVSVELDASATGPIALGQLSHFGLGLFQCRA